MKDAEKWLQEVLVVEGPRLAAMIDATSRDPVEVIGEWSGELAVAGYAAGHKAATESLTADLVRRLRAERERCRARLDDEHLAYVHARYEGRIHATEIALRMLGVEVKS